MTVATNMAGRGTDIMLGGNPEFRAVAELKRRGLDPVETEEYEAAWDEALAGAEAAVAAEHDEVTGIGGLYVLGTERHESRRIDNQLRVVGPAARATPASRGSISLQDDLMRLFNAALVDRFMVSAGMEDDQPIESKMVTNSIQKAQGAVEAQNYEIRKNVLKYDDVMNRQRQVIYEERRAVLQGRTCTSSCGCSSTTSSAAMSTPRPPRGSLGTGTSSASGRPCVRCIPLASRSRSSRTSRAAGTASTRTCCASS